MFMVHIQWGVMTPGVQGETAIIFCTLFLYCYNYIEKNTFVKYKLLSCLLKNI